MAKKRRNKIPVEPFETTVLRLSHEGRGIASVNGKTTFVFNGLPDEKIQCQYKRQFGKYDEADALSVLTTNPNRVEPKCAHFGLCGGCELQHLLPEAQIQHKQGVLLELLNREGIIPKHTLTPLTGPNTGYRHKARIGMKYVPGKSKVLVGFRERGNSFIADLSQCEVLHPSVGKKIKSISDLVFQMEGKSELPQIEIAVDDTKAALIVRHLKPLSDFDFEQLKQYCITEQFALYLQSKGIDSIRWIPTHDQNQSPLLTYQLQKQSLSFDFLPWQFTQVNPMINEQMVERAISLLDLKENDTVLDLFCGIGNFSLPLAKYTKHVTGIEGDELAVTMARHNAIKNKISNADFIVANLFESINHLNAIKNPFNKILIDPPRTGALEILPKIIELQPEKILYISCNPSTLARDAKHLTEAGYTATQAGVMDMFPHTKHTEAMVLFE